MTSDRPNVAFFGRMGAGKTTAAQYLVDHHGYTRLSFAQALKDVAARIYGEQARYDRGLLQKLGPGLRELDPDCWVQALLTTMANEDSGPFVVDDMRYPNEYWTLQEHGFVTVRVVADEDLRVSRLLAINKLQDRAQLEHASETALDKYWCDHIIYNRDEPEDLYERVGTVLHRELSRT